VAADSTPAVAAVEDIADVEDLPEEPMTKIDMLPADISCKPPAVSVAFAPASNIDHKNSVLGSQSSAYLYHSHILLVQGVVTSCQ